MARHPVAWFSAKHAMTGPSLPCLKKARRKKKRRTSSPSSDICIARGPSCRKMVRSRERRYHLIGSRGASRLPATRVPHVWLQRDSQRVSTLHLLHGRFVLLMGTNGTPLVPSGKADRRDRKRTRL